MIAGFDAKGLPWRTDHSWKWGKLRTADSETPDGQVALRAVDILEKTRPVAKPFFLSVGFRRPHSPYAVPARYFDRYPTAAMRLPEEPPGHVSSIPRAALTYDPAQPVPPERAREVIGAYYASITFVDAQVGLILEALDRNQLWENTIVVFMGDHGYHLGEHGGMWHKQSLFEESVRAPLIIVGPGIKANGVAPRPVEHLNLYPTLAQLAGLSTPGGLQGLSMVPLLKNPRVPWDHPAFSQTDRGAIRGRTVRTERWRYTEWDNGRSGRQLYDHRADSREFVNLADDPRHAATVARLSKLLQKSVTAPAKSGQPGKL
jgi:iduronate 2-sulfatase